MVMWNNKKNIKKKADSAMATFLPIDEDKNPLIILSFEQKYKDKIIHSDFQTMNLSVFLKKM